MKHFRLAIFAGTFGLAVSAALAASSPRAAEAVARRDWNAAIKVQPIVDAQSGYLIGGSARGNWIAAKDVAKTLKANEKYSVYGSSTFLGKTTGSKPRSQEAPCEETQWVTLKKNFNGVLGLSETAKPIPRKVRVQNVNQKIYRDAVMKILKAGKIKNPKVVVSQIWRVDLDGDNTDEVLISATHYANPRGEKPQPFHISSSANAGDYSLVLLRKIIRGKVQTIVLEQEIYAQNKEFSAPSMHRLSGVYDLNGDGNMEILLNSRYYEGDWMSVVEVKGAAAREVLSVGCGA